MSGVTLNANGTFNFADRPGQGWQTYLIQATQRGTGNGGSNAVAQQVRQVYVPPTNESLRYDSGGNRAGDSRWTLSWNSFGQLTEAKDANPSGSTDIVFTYDYKGRMVQKLKSVNGTVVSIMRTLYDGWKPVLQIDSNGAGSELARRIYTWGPDVSGTNGGAAGIGGLIEMVEKKGGTIANRLAIHDGKGNVTGWVDESTGARVATYSYGPFGEPVSASGSSAADCPLRWQTKLYDEDLGLYYFGKRWYDSKTRTWISPDPLRENGGVNVTCYCDNQPFDEHDPVGLLTQSQRDLLIADSASAVDIIRRYGGVGVPIWSPQDVLNTTLKTSGFGLTNAGWLPTSKKWDLMHQYPGESEQDVALLESTRHNVAAARVALAESGMLTGAERHRVMFRPVMGLYGITLLTITAPLMVQEATISSAVGNSIRVPIADSASLLRPINPIGQMKGPVRFVPPANATEAEIAEIQAYVQGANAAWRVGELSPVGRVSTVGSLRAASSKAAALERSQTTYFGVAGHVPDTTWRGVPDPYMWLDQTQRINSSLGAQSLQYPLGFKPTGFTIGE